MIPASSTFESFLQSGLDRAAFIAAWLRSRDIPHTVVDLAGKRHIVIRFDASAYDPRFRMKTLVAHYDRAGNTPGANDNSAACFQLMLFAERLAAGESAGDAPNKTDARLCHNIRIFFTDGEEAAGTKGIAGQGAFALGSGLRKLKMTEDDVYVFDACGRGDTLVLSTAGMDDYAGQGKKKATRVPTGFASRLEEMHEQAASLALAVSSENWVRLPTPYSDNAGFIAAGIPAQVITILPHLEASALLHALGTAAGEKEKQLIDTTIIANKPLTGDSPLRRIIPETWQLMHTPLDAAPTLTASAFKLMERLLEEIARRMEVMI